MSAIDAIECADDAGGGNASFSKRPTQRKKAHVVVVADTTGVHFWGCCAHGRCCGLWRLLAEWAEAATGGGQTKLEAKEVLI